MFCGLLLHLYLYLHLANSPTPPLSSLALPVGNQLLGRQSRLIGSAISGYQVQQTPCTAATPLPPRLSLSSLPKSSPPLPAQ